VINVGLTLEQAAVLLGFSIGYLWGEAFSRTDQAIKYKSEWFKRQSAIIRWLVSSLLDAMHHFQYGLALILAVLVLGDTLPLVVQLLLAYAGWGLVASDWRDFENVFKRLGLIKVNENLNENSADSAAGLFKKEGGGTI